MATVKLKGSELNLSSPSNVNFATLVRVVNNKTTIQAIIHADKDGAVIGSFKQQQIRFQELQHH